MMAQAWSIVAEQFHNALNWAVSLFEGVGAIGYILGAFAIGAIIRFFVWPLFGASMPISAPPDPDPVATESASWTETQHYKQLDNGWWQYQGKTASVSETRRPTR